MNIKDRIEDLEKALKDAEYYAAHLVSEIVSNYNEELDPKKIDEIDNFVDNAITTLKQIRCLKNEGQDNGWGKHSIIEKLKASYEESKNEDNENERDTKL